MMRSRSDGRSSGPAGGFAAPTEPHGTATTRIHKLAVDGKTGAVQIVGRPGGHVYLVDGHIVYAESPGTPGVEAAVLRAVQPDEAAWAATVASMQTPSGRRVAAAEAGEVVASGAVPPVRLDAAVQSATAEALLAMLAGYDVTFTRTRFVNGQRPWIALGRPLAPGAALAETTRRRRLLASMGRCVRPDDDVERVAATGTAAVRLSPQQWDLVRLCAERCSPRDLAWLVGRGVLATTIDVYELMGLGVLTTASAHGGRADRVAGSTRRTVSFLAASVPETWGRGES